MDDAMTVVLEDGDAAEQADEHKEREVIELDSDNDTEFGGENDSVNGSEYQPTHAGSDSDRDEQFKPRRTAGKRPRHELATAASRKSFRGGRAAAAANVTEDGEEQQPVMEVAVPVAEPVIPQLQPIAAVLGDAAPPQQVVVEVLQGPADLGVVPAPLADETTDFSELGLMTQMARVTYNSARVAFENARNSLQALLNMRAQRHQVRQQV